MKTREFVILVNSFDLWIEWVSQGSRQGDKMPAKMEEDDDRGATGGFDLDQLVGTDSLSKVRTQC